MIIFWLVMLFNLLSYIILKKYFRVNYARDAAVIFTLLASSFLIVAILTRDPLFSSFGVPPEFEWIVGLFITGLASWKLYFNPLKERVIRTEREVSSIKTDVTSIKDDVSLIKEKVLTTK